MENHKERRLADTIYLLSRRNYWDSIKISYDILINELFLYSTRRRGIKQYEIENAGITALCLLHDFLLEKNVDNIDELLNEMRMLTVFFNNYSREILSETFNSEKLKTLAVNLVGLISFIHKNDISSTYHFGGIPKLLEMELKSDTAQQLYKATTPYFNILFISKSLFNKDFWADLDSFNSGLAISVFTPEEFRELSNYRNLLQKKQLLLAKEDLSRIEVIWGTTLRITDIERKINLQYTINYLYEDLDEFRRVDLSASKYNLYKKEKEKAFHHSVYAFFSQRNYDSVLSEMTAGDNRHDIVVYKRENGVSAIIELKVNALTALESDINQLCNYLDKVGDRRKIYVKSPSIGVLAIYYIGATKTLDKVKLQQLVPGKKLRQHTDNFYLYTPETGAPIIIAIFNGKC